MKADLIDETKGEKICLRRAGVQTNCDSLSFFGKELQRVIFVLYF
jgi:hypothetical protein